MWEYGVDLQKISDVIHKRAIFVKSHYYAEMLLKELGFTSEKVKRSVFEDIIYTHGDFEEVYTSEEMNLISSEGKIFYSIGIDIFNFFIIDIAEEEYSNWYRIAGITKIINKAFKGNNFIIFQLGDRLLFSSRYYSYFAVRDFHMTYWIDDINVIGEFTAYNLCKKNAKYTYANYVAHVSKNSIFKEKNWVRDDSQFEDQIEYNFVEMSKQLSFIASKQIDSFDFMREAEEAGKYAEENGMLYAARQTSDVVINEPDIDEELFDNPEMLLKFIR